MGCEPLISRMVGLVQKLMVQPDHFSTLSGSWKKPENHCSRDTTPSFNPTRTDTKPQHHFDFETVLLLCCWHRCSAVTWSPTTAHSLNHVALLLVTAQPQPLPVTARYCFGVTSSRLWWGTHTLPHVPTRQLCCTTLIRAHNKASIQTT